MAKLLIGIVAAVTASALFNLAVVVQASEARAVPLRYALRFALLRRLVRRRRWLAGTGLALLAWPLQTAALLLAPLTVVQPADAVGLAILLVVGARVLGERVGTRERLAVAGIVVGVTGLAFVAPDRTTHHASTPAVVAALAILGIVAAAPYVLRERLGSEGLAVVFAAGCAFAATAFSTKLIADSLSDADWIALVLLIAFTAVLAGLGALNEMTALQRRPAAQVAPIIFVAELVAPVLLAMLLAHEAPRGDPLRVGVLVLSLAVVTVSVVTLGRSKAVAGMVSASHAG